MERFENAKIDDEVFCEVYGYGKIVSFIDGSTFPVVVEFSSEYQESYVLDGRIRKEATKPTLFYRKGTERNLTERPVEEINWKEYVGKQILVKGEYRSEWTENKLYGYDPELNRPFICFNKDGEGRVTRDLCTWKYAKLIEAPTEEINWKEWEGKEILVRDSANQGWAKKRLYRYQPEFTFRFACESQTDKTMPTSWKYAKLVEPSSFSAMSAEYAPSVEEKPQEIDWTKVATGTQVIVSDSENFYPCNTREFFTYRPDLEYNFWVFDGDWEEAYGYKYCKIV